MPGQPTTQRLRPLVLCLLGAFAAGVAPRVFAAGKAAGGGGGGGAASVVAQDGVTEFGIKGLLDLDASDDTAAYADVTLGYFILSGFELGLSVLQGTTEEGQRDTNGVFFEYDLMLWPRVLPLAGLALKHAAPPRGNEDQDAKIVEIYTGALFTLGQNAALTAILQWQIADQPVLGAEGARSRSDRDLSLGLRFYF